MALAVPVRSGGAGGSSADWLIDLGPEGGAGGGKLVTRGTPETVIKHKTSYNGKFLKMHLERHGK